MPLFYHITLTEAVVSLLTRGADPSRIGTNSLKSGPGFHLTRTYTWAEEWGRELFAYPSPSGPETTILQVILPETARLATSRDMKDRAVLERWGKVQGYLQRNGEPSEKLLQVLHEENWQEESEYFLDAIDKGAFSALLGLDLMEQGFDCYWSWDNDLVITNFSLLSPSAFAMASKSIAEGKPPSPMSEDDNGEALTRAEALVVVAEIPKDDAQRQQIFRGLQILAKYDENLSFAFEHDQVFVADVDATVRKMTKEEVIELASCGWFWSEESWSHFA